MSKNYTALHYIQNQLKGYDTNFVDCITRCFNYMEQIKADRECLSSSVVLYICAKKYGYNPQICYGLCSLDEKEFYHAWLEISDTVIDLAIYGNVNYNPYSMWDFKLDTPYIGTYEDAQVQYGKHKFDGDWPSCSFSFIDDISVIDYMNKAPHNAMWKLVCKILDKTPTKSLVNELEEYISGVYFK